MIPAAFDYTVVDSADAAIAALAEHGDEAKLLAGLADKHLKHYQTDAPAADALLKNGAKMANAALDKSELAAWTSIARVVLNLHENITRN